jgi:hypothetical protein
MRTKTLLTVAAALAVSAITSMAQTTYSQNVVGYINVTIPAGGFAPLGNTLINGSDVAKTNNDINACFGTGLISDSYIASIGGDPANGSNSMVFIWTGAFGSALYYFNATDATTWEGFSSPAGWYDQSGTYYTGITVAQSQVAFLANSANSPAAMTATITGNVFQGTNNTTIEPGYNFISYVAPIGGTNPVGSVFGLPTTMTSIAHPPGDLPTMTTSDTIFTWNATGLGGFNSGYYYFNASDATDWEGFSSPAGFYDQSGSPMPDSLYPTVNQGFFLYHNGSAISWNPSFTVQ